MVNGEMRMSTPPHVYVRSVPWEDKKRFAFDVFAFKFAETPSLAFFFELQAMLCFARAAAAAAGLPSLGHSTASVRLLSVMGCVDWSLCWTAVCL